MTILTCSMLGFHKVWLPHEAYFRKEVSCLKYVLVPIQHHGEEGWLVSTGPVHLFRKIPIVENLLINSYYLIVTITWEKKGVADAVDAPLISP